MGMLVISRRDGESLHIGPEVQVRILSVRGNQVRLGIDAPKHMAVYRSELKEQFEKAGAIVVDDSVADESDMPTAVAA